MKLLSSIVVDGIVSLSGVQRAITEDRVIGGVLPHPATPAISGRR